MQLMTTPSEPARADSMELLDRYWRVANYLSVGQIYLLDNPLLKEPLKPRTLAACGILAFQQIGASSHETARVARDRFCLFREICASGLLLDLASNLQSG